MQIKVWNQPHIQKVVDVIIRSQPSVGWMDTDLIKRDLTYAFADTVLDTSWTVKKVADLYNVSLIAANELLEHYLEQAESAKGVTKEALDKAKAELDETKRKSAEEDVIKQDIIDNHCVSKLLLTAHSPINGEVLDTLIRTKQIITLIDPATNLDRYPLFQFNDFRSKQMIEDPYDHAVLPGIAELIKMFPDHWSLSMFLLKVPDWAYLNYARLLEHDHLSTVMDAAKQYLANKGATK